MTAVAEQTLVEVRRLRARTRSRAHAGAWLPRPAVAVGAGALVALAVLAAVPVQSVDYSAVGWRHALLSPLLVIAVALVALGWAERSAAVALAGGWVAVITAWQTASGRLGHIPGWLDWILDGGSGPALGGEVTLANLNRPGPLLIAIALPLVVFAVVRGSRARDGVAYGGDA
jgi:hypothetical protein